MTAKPPPASGATFRYVVDARIPPGLGELAGGEVGRARVAALNPAAAGPRTLPVSGSDGIVLSLFR